MNGTTALAYSTTRFIARKTSEFDSVIAVQDWTTDNDGHYAYSQDCKERQPMTRPQ